MTEISKQSWFHGLLPREDVKAMLKVNGDFLIRTSEPVAGRARHLILSLMQNSTDQETGTRHYVICEDGAKFSVNENKIFTTIHELIDFYKKSPINIKEESSILVNPIERQFWELAHENIKLTKTLGEGAFGEVKKGTLATKNGQIVEVAVKVAKLEKCTKEQIKEIMAEARLMRNFDHKNVVKCYGTAAGQEPLMVVMELVCGGGLDSYLTKNSVKIAEKLDIMYQVAQGVEYIHRQEVIHRDIAARNCLYGNGIVKVSDFGLSRRGTTYQMNPKNKVPIRWLAPETLQTFFYSGPSDVFAFGILCWEVLENGKQPYPEMTVADVHQKVMKENYRMGIPIDAPHELSELIKKCWLSQPSDRPRAESLVKTLSRLVPPEKREKTVLQQLEEKSCPDDEEAEEANTQRASALVAPSARKPTAVSKTDGLPRATTPTKSGSQASVPQPSASEATSAFGGKNKKRRNRFLDRGNPLLNATRSLSGTKVNNNTESQDTRTQESGQQKIASEHIQPGFMRSRPSCHLMLKAERKSRSRANLSSSNDNKEAKSGIFGKKKKRPSSNLKWQ